MCSSDLAVAILVAAPIAAHFYGEPELLGLSAVLAISLPLSTLSTVPMTLLRASFRYRLIAGVTVSEGAATQALTICCALAGLGAYSLVLPIPVVAAARSMLLWYVAPAKLRARLQPRRWGGLIGGSASVFASKLIIATVNQGDYVILGLLGSTATVGAYFFAFRLAVQPVQILAGNLTNVLLPTLSQYRDHPYTQGEAALQVARLLGILIMPFAFCEAAAAEPAMHLVFGTKWDAAIPLIQILSIALAFDSIAWIAGTLLLASRRYRANLIFLSIISPLFFLFVWVGGRHGSAVGVAEGVGLYYAVVTPFYSWLTFRSYGIGTWQVVRLYVVPASAAAFAFGVGEAFAGLTHMGSALLSSACVIIIGLLVYISIYRCIDPSLIRNPRGRLRIPVTVTVKAPL